MERAQSAQTALIRRGRKMASEFTEANKDNEEEEEREARRAKGPSAGPIHRSKRIANKDERVQTQ
jgi:hypothetical protein